MSGSCLGSREGTAPLVLLAPQMFNVFTYITQLTVLEDSSKPFLAEEHTDANPRHGL